MAAEDAQDQAVTTSTNTKRLTNWRAWLFFLTIIEFEHDPFLTTVNQRNTVKFISWFAAAIRENGTKLEERINKPGPGVNSGSVRGALDTLATTFRANQLPSPVHDANGRFNWILDRQLKGFNNADPGTVHQKAISPIVIKQIVRQAISSSLALDIAIAQLVVGAFFFAMRSCEYSKVTGERRTKLLTIGNIRFYKDRRALSQDSTLLHLAESVSITFVMQKNEERDETITQHRTSNITLCPVRAWAAIVTRIRGYQDTNNDTPVNTYEYKGKLCYVSSVNVLKAIRAAVTVLGPDHLGYTAAEVGTHSLRSSAAMAMYLAGVPVFTIMLIGRWSSDAFLRYIRRQVQEFSSGVSSKMILSSDYFTIPDYTSPEDPRTSGNTLNLAARGQIGAVASGSNTRSKFALWH